MEGADAMALRVMVVPGSRFTMVALPMGNRWRLGLKRVEKSEGRLGHESEGHAKTARTRVSLRIGRITGEDSLADECDDWDAFCQSDCAKPYE